MNPNFSYKFQTTPLPPTTQSSSVFNFLFNTIKTFQGNERERQYSESIEQPPIEEIADNNSDEEVVPVPPMSPTPTQFHSSSSSSSSTASEETTTPPPMTTSSPVLFTLPPSTSTMSHSSGFTSSSSSSRKYPTRPPERTSFTSSEEVSASTYKHYDYRKPYMSPPRRTSSEETTTTAETTSLPSVESSVSNESYQADESKKLSSMLADQIPPHHDEFDSHEYTATTVSPSSSSAQTEDTLAKLIRNIQPKWNKTTTATTPRTRNRYIEIRHHHKDKSRENDSGERYKSQRPVTTLPPTTVYIVTPEKPTTSLLPTTSEENDQSHVQSSGRKVPSSSNKSPLEVVRGPKLKDGNNSKNDKDQSDESNSKEYLDILVGSDDHQKTLVTKKTESGSIITSAILPPWFDQSQNSTDSLELTNDTLKFTTEKIVRPSDDDSDIPNDKMKSDLDALFDLFSPSSSKEDENESLATKRKDAKPKSETYISDVAPEESKAIHLKKLEDELKPFFSSPSEPAEKPPPSVPKPNRNLLPPPNTGYHYGPSSDGKTHVFGYYPEDEPLDDGPPVKPHVAIEIDDRSDNLVQQQQQNRRNGSAEMTYDDEPETSDVSDGQSPVIDIAYDPKVDPEIVIEPEAGELDDDEYNDDNVSELIHEPMAAGSDAHSGQVYVPPPANMINNHVKSGNNGAVDPHDGGGIRRPTKNDRKYGGSQPMQEQVERPGKVDWSSKERPSVKPSDWSAQESNINHNMAPPKRWTSKETITSPSDSAEDEDEGPPNKEILMEPEEFSDEEFLQGEEDSPRGQAYYGNDNVSPNRNGTEAEETIEDAEFSADRKVERKPIVDVDASLYDIKDGNVITTTTPKPRVRVYEVYSEPYKPSAPAAEPPTERPESLTSEELSNQTGFVPPEPINFHENTFAGDEQSSSEYISRDGWRPVIYNRGKEEKLANGRKRPNSLVQQPQQKQQQSQSAPQFSSPVRAPTFTAPQAVPITTPLHIPPTTPSNMGPTGGEYEDEMISQENNWYPDQPQPNRASSSVSKMTIKPSRPIPPMLLQPQPPRMRFPGTGPNPPFGSPEQQQHQQQPPYPPHNIREGQQVPHPLNPQQNLQSPPHAQVHHNGPPQQQQQNQQMQHQQQNQQMPHQQQNQQMPHQQQNQHIQHQQQAQASSPQNSVVDRSKYSQRPVRPPIVMRRKPPFPFSPGNRKRITKVRINGPPRSPPRGPPYSPPPQQQQLPSSPEQYHSQQQHDNNKSNQQQQQVIRQRHDPPFHQQPLPPPHSHPGNSNMMPHGTVHWPPDDMFLRRQQPPMINRRPSG